MSKPSDNSHKSPLAIKGEGPLGCSVCHVQFATAEERIQHARKKHNVHLARYPCTACNLAGYKNIYTLRIHMKTKCFGLGWETRLGETASAPKGEEKVQKAFKASTLTASEETSLSELKGALLSVRKRKTSVPAEKPAKIPKKELKSGESGSQDSGSSINQKSKSIIESTSLAIEPKIPSGSSGGLTKHVQKKFRLPEAPEASLLKKTRRDSLGGLQSNDSPENLRLALEKVKRCKNASLSEHAPQSNTLHEEKSILTSNEIPSVDDAGAPSTSQIARKSRSRQPPSTEISEDCYLVSKKADSKTATKRRFSQTGSERDVPSVTPSVEGHFAASGIRSRTRANSMLVKRDLNRDVFNDGSIEVLKRSSQKDPEKKPSLDAAGDSSKPLTENNSSLPSIGNKKDDNATIEASPIEKTEPNRALETDRLESVVEENTAVGGNTPELPELIHSPEGSKSDSSCKNQINAWNPAAEDSAEAVLTRGSSKVCNQNVEIDIPTEKSPGTSIVSSDLQRQIEENLVKAVKLAVASESTYQSEGNKDPTRAHADIKPIESVAAQHYAYESMEEASELSSEVIKKMKQNCASEEVKPESPEIPESKTINGSRELCKGISSVSDISKPLALIQKEQPAAIKESEPGSTDTSLDAKRLELKRLRESLGVDVCHQKPVNPLTSPSASAFSLPVTPMKSAAKSLSSSSSPSLNASSQASGKLALLDWDSFIAKGKSRPLANKSIQRELKRRPPEEKYTIITNAGEKSKLQSAEVKFTASSNSTNVPSNDSSEKSAVSTIAGSPAKPNLGERSKSMLQNKEAKSAAFSKKTKIPTNESPLSSEKFTTPTTSRGSVKPNAEEQSKSNLQTQELKSSSSSKNTEDPVLSNEPQEPADSYDRASADDASSISTIPFRLGNDDKIETESDVDSETQSGQNEKMTMLSCPVCRLGGFATKAELKVHLTISCRQEPKKKKRPIEWYCPGCPRSFGPFESAKALLDHLPTCHIRRVALFGGGSSRGKGKAPLLDPNDLPLWPLPLPSTPVTFGCPVCGCFFATASRLDQHRSEADHFHVVGRFLNTNGHLKASK